MRTFEAFAANERGIGHEFWLFHGMNYLAGNPFPGIYKGNQIYRGMLFAHIMAKHVDPDGKLTEPGRKCLIWISTTPKELYRAVVYIRAFVRKYQRDPHIPGDPYVRIAVDAMARVMIEPTKDWGQTEQLPLRDYYLYWHEYDLSVRRAKNNVLRFDPRTRRGWMFWADVHREALARYGLPPGVPMPRLEYRERQDRGYLKHTGRIEDKRKKTQ